MFSVNVFSIYHGRDMSVAIPFENYPVPERYGYRRWTNNVYPCYDINNNYMGYIDNGIFYDMREGWYCVRCDYETDSFWNALSHNIKHFLSTRKRKMVIDYQLCRI